MSKSHANGHSSTASPHDSPRHAADDALDDREFQLLLEATYDLEDMYALEARVIVFALGRLGMRVGELVHMRADWVDWRRRMIDIPQHEPCQKGRGGDICGYCRQLAVQQAAHNPGLSVDAALAQRWQPKTDAAARSIPFDFHPGVEIAIERYFQEFDRFQTSKSGVNRRLAKALERVDELDSGDIYPHCLRATAASFHASRGLDAISLQSLLGWADLSTAHRYVRRSGDRTRKALHAAHSR